MGQPWGQVDESTLDWVRYFPVDSVVSDRHVNAVSAGSFSLRAVSRLLQHGGGTGHVESRCVSVLQALPHAWPTGGAVEWAALQMLRDDMPTLFQGVHSMRCFVWQDNMVLMSRFVRDAMRMVRAASSGDELDV